MGERRKGQYPDELRERAVRMVQESSEEYSSQWGAIKSIAEKLGIGSGETLLVQKAHRHSWIGCGEDRHPQRGK